MDLRLEWNWEIDLDGLKVSQSTVVELNAEIRDWRLSPIVDDTQTIHGDTIAIRAELRLQRLSDTQVQYTFTTVSVDISAVRQEGRGSDRDCFSRLRPGLWQEGCGDNWAADPKILLLAGLHTWLATLSTSAEGDAPWTAQRVAATYIYVIAWRLIYGADLMAGDQERCRATRLADLLQKLLQRLCEGMTYPGPRCHGCFHGVVLGTLELNTKWQVTGFDSWEGRQHVLLGPLVSHWAGQFGFASLDVVAGRFAQMLCCVAGLPSPRVGKVAPPAEMIAMNTGARFMFGSTSDVQKEMMMEGLPLVSSRTVSPTAFVGSFLAAITSDKPPNANAGFRHSIFGNQAGKALHLLVPEDAKDKDSSEYANIPVVGALMNLMSGGNERASSAVSGHAHIADALRVHKDQGKVPALARKAVLNDIESTLASLPIKKLHIELEGEVYKILAKSGVRTINDVLAVGAEAISTYILRGTDKGEENDEHAILVDGLVGSAEEVADRLVDGWVAVAGKQGRSFRRNHVEDAKIRKAVAASVGTAGRKLKEKIDLLPPKRVPAKPKLVTALKSKPKAKSKAKPKAKPKPANQESDSPDDKGTDKN
ncbi:MAG: hypothetical protein JKY56_14285, partial [Kofleriaceae bacterium]|nr:hypothetical protein [Kofleriaceae bacterium]